MSTPTTSWAIGYSSSCLARHFFNNHMVFLSNNPSVVYAIFLLETVQTVLTGVDLYLSFASGFGHMYRLTRPNMSAFDVPIIESMVSLTVQLFFAYRVWILSDKKSLRFCLAICVVCRDHTTLIRIPQYKASLLTVFYCRCNCSIHRRYLCRPRPVHTAFVRLTRQQIGVRNTFASGLALKVLAFVGPVCEQNYLPLANCYVLRPGSLAAPWPTSS
jgi:hypothetical protein